MDLVENHTPREYSTISHNGGIVLCDKREGAFLVLRFPEDVERLKETLNAIDVNRIHVERKPCPECGRILGDAIFKCSIWSKL